MLAGSGAEEDTWVEEMRAMLMGASPRRQQQAKEAFDQLSQMDWLAIRVWWAVAKLRGRDAVRRPRTVAPRLITRRTVARFARVSEHRVQQALDSFSLIRDYYKHAKAGGYYP